jgi:PAS domain S-box-containing protein
LSDALGRLLDVELTVMLESYHLHLAERIERTRAVERDALSVRAARAEHRYEGAVELAKVVTIGIDREGKVLLFNREAEAVTGYARDEVLGMRFVDVLVPEDLRETYEAALAAERPEETTLPLLTRAKKVRHVSWQLARAPDEKEDDVGVFAIGQDVTELRAARQRQEQQERLAAVGTLAAGLAHEIRNPLNGAQLHVSFLERALTKNGASPDAVESVHVVRDEIRRLARLVTDFLDFARPRPLKLAPTTARALAERARQLVISQAQDAGVELTVDVPDAEIAFEADAERLGQVLLNLLQNAIEAAAHGEGGTGHVVLRARRQPRDVRIEVEDDGPGLPPGNAPVFDAFFSTKPSGTGLGLAIVHRIVTDHGGIVDVESRPGHTQFCVLLPLDH